MKRWRSNLFLFTFLQTITLLAREALALEVSTFKLGDINSEIQVNGLLQVWSIGNVNDSPKNQNVRLRRAEIKFGESFERKLKVSFMVDPAKLIPPPGGGAIAAVNLVQDLSLAYRLFPGFEITAGQFKIPTTAEGLDSSAALLLPERSLIGRTAGDKRELGLKLTYQSDAWNVATMFSSARTLQTEGSILPRDWITRMEVLPLKDLGLGGFVNFGDFSYSKKGRWGLNARYEIQKFKVRTEYSQAMDSGNQTSGATFESSYAWNSVFEPVIRYEIFNSGKGSNGLGTAKSLGVNYYLKRFYSKLEASASLLQNMTAVNGTPTFANAANNMEFLLTAQTFI